MSSDAKGAPIVIVWLCGCAATPDYRAPEFPPAATGPFVSTSTLVDAATSAPDAWWLLYQDEVLAKLVQEALDKNADLKVAMANLAISRAVLDEARAGRYPGTQLNAGVLYGRNSIADSIAATAHRSAGNVYTLDYSHLLGPGNRTEPGLSVWIPQPS